MLSSRPGERGEERERREEQRDCLISAQTVEQQQQH